MCACKSELPNIYGNVIGESYFLKKLGLVTKPKSKLKTTNYCGVSFFMRETFPLNTDSGQI